MLNAPITNETREAMGAAMDLDAAYIDEDFLKGKAFSEILLRWHEVTRTDKVAV